MTPATAPAAKHVVVCMTCGRRIKDSAWHFPVAGAEPVDGATPVQCGACAGYQVPKP